MLCSHQNEHIFDIISLSENSTNGKIRQEWNLNHTDPNMNLLYHHAQISKSAYDLIPNNSIVSKLLKMRPGASWAIVDVS